MRIVHVFETHTHADHLSGHGRLAARAPCFPSRSIRAARSPSFPNEPFADGQTFPLRHGRDPRDRDGPGTGRSTARSLANDELIMTGDSLFIGDAGATRSRGRGRARERLPSTARCGGLADLPPQVVVYPGHVRGLALRHEHELGAREHNRPREAHETTRLREAEEEFVEQSASLTTPRAADDRVARRPESRARGSRPGLGSGSLAAGRARTTVLGRAPRSKAFAAGHFPRGDQASRSTAARFATRAAFVLGPGESVVVPRRPRRRTSPMRRGSSHAVGLFEQPWLRPRRRQRDDANNDRRGAGPGCSRTPLICRCSTSASPGRREGSAIPGAIELSRIARCGPAPPEGARPPPRARLHGPAPAARRAMLAAKPARREGLRRPPPCSEGGAADLADEGVELLTESQPR